MQKLSYTNWWDIHVDVFELWDILKILQTLFSLLVLEVKESGFSTQIYALCALHLGHWLWDFYLPLTEE